MWLLEEEEEIQALEETGVDGLYVRRISLATTQGNDIRCKTTSPLARSRHYVNDK